MQIDKKHEDNAEAVQSVLEDADRLYEYLMQDSPKEKDATVSPLRPVN